MAPIPYGRQSINEEDIEAVAQVLRGDWLTTGPTVTAFEEAIASYAGAAKAAPPGRLPCTSRMPLQASVPVTRSSPLR